jgi:glycerophosphoryl diester phosphodiesterase
MDTIKINKGNAQIVAHRGLSGLERENTASAFVAAGNRSYFGIETDVRPTADGHFVLLHDDNPVRCGGDMLIPEQSTLQTIQSVQLFDVDGKRGRVDLRIPEMVDYLRICKRYDKVCVLEFKGYFSVENMEKVVEIVKAEYTLDKMIFISFSFENLLNLRKVCPESHCQFLTGEFKDEIIEMLKEHKMGIDIWSNALDEEWKVKKLLDEGIEVNTWTVDNKELAEKLISWGVQYVTSNILE